MANEKRSGSTKAADSNRTIRNRNRNSGIDGADIGTADPQRLQEAICAVTRRGCALQLGYTRDGGAIVVRFVGDGENPYNEYIRATEDFDIYLAGVIEDFSATD